MPATKQAKTQLVKDLIAEVSAAKEEVLVGYQGLTVAELQELRRKLRAAGISMRVVKNTLIDRVLTEAKVEGLSSRATKKPLALVIGNDEVMPAKLLVEFAKTHKQLEIVAGAIDRTAVDAAQLESLALLPNREEMLGIVVRTIAAPVSSFVRVLGGVPRGLVQVLSQVAKTKSA
ncbi:MAG: 50S ribosomal protein L10 [Candidatus Andersenbacteria bacterium]